jgi:hypothetical protein
MALTEAAYGRSLDTIPAMGAIWIGILAVIGSGLALVAMKRRSSSRRTDVDVGSLSDLRAPRAEGFLTSPQFPAAKNGG